MTLTSAVVGGGVVADVHLNGLDACPHTDLVAICDVDESTAREHAAAHDIDAYTDVETLLSAADPDWLHVCTPVDTHLPIAEQAIDAGVPVLIEKPVTGTVEEFEQLQAAAETANVNVAVVHQHLFDPAVRTVRKEIADGTIGDVRGVTMVYTGETRPDREQRGEWTFDLPGGEFEEGLPHPIYLALGTGGYPASTDDVRVLTSLVDEYDHPFDYDNTQVQYRTDDGALCSVQILSGGVRQRQLQIHGEDRSLTADLISQTVERIDHRHSNGTVGKIRNNLDRAADRVRGTVEMGRAVGADRIVDDWDHAKEINPHFYQFGEEARAIQSGRGPVVPLEEAGWTLRLLAAIREDAAPESAPLADG